MKKILLSLGATGLVMAPVASVISCSDSSVKLEEKIKSLHIAPLEVGSAPITQEKLKLKDTRKISDFWIGAASFDKAKASSATEITTQAKLKEVTGLELGDISKKIIDTWKEVKASLDKKSKDNKWSATVNTAIEGLLNAMLEIIPVAGQAETGYKDINIRALNTITSTFVTNEVATTNGPAIFDIPVKYGKKDVFMLTETYKSIPKLVDAIHYELKIMWLSIQIASTLAGLSSNMDFSSLESSMPKA